MVKMHHEEFSKEELLKNQAKRELANGVKKNSLDKLRLLCFSRGATGILGLARTFRAMDNDGNKTLSMVEFKKGIAHMGFDFTESDIQDLFKSFDIDDNGTINMTEFLLKLRPPMGVSRMDIIEKSFAKLDTNSDGQISIQDLKSAYSVRDHPKYLSGELTENEILTTFLKNFKAGAPNQDGIITKHEFIDYYATISASIDNDAYFDLLLRRAYKI